MCNSQIFKNAGNRQVKGKTNRNISMIFDPSGGVTSSLALSEATTKYASGQDARESGILKDSAALVEENRLNDLKNAPDPTEQQTTAYQKEIEKSKSSQISDKSQINKPLQTKKEAEDYRRRVRLGLANIRDYQRFTINA